MYRIPIAITFASLFAVCVAMMYVLWNYGNNQPSELPFPAQLDLRVFLPKGDAGEVSRTVQYSEDGGKISATVEFVDGSIGHMRYHADGKAVSEFSIHYPETHSDGASPASQLKMSAAYDTDGRTYLWRKEFRPDGSLVLEGERQEDNTYRVQSFFDDGTTVAQVERFDQQGTLIFDQRYTIAGVPTYLFRVKEDQTRETTSFTDLGVPTFTHRKQHYGIESWQYYHEDGESVRAFFEIVANGNKGGVTYYIHASYFDRDGSLNHKRRFSRSHMYVEVYDAEQVLFTQQWSYIGDGQDRSLVAENWKLDGVVRGSNNFLGNQESFWFHGDGAVRRHVFPVTIDGGEIKQATRDYREDGSLASQSDPNMDGSGYTRSSHEPGEATARFSVVIPPEMLEQLAFMVPPVDVPTMKVHRGNQH